MEFVDNRATKYPTVTVEVRTLQRVGAHAGAAEAHCCDCLQFIRGMAPRLALRDEHKRVREVVG